MEGFSTLTNKHILNFAPHSHKHTAMVSEQPCEDTPGIFTQPLIKIDWCWKDIICSSHGKAQSPRFYGPHTLPTDLLPLHTVPLCPLSLFAKWGAIAAGVEAQTVSTRSLIFQAAGCCRWSIGHWWSPSAVVAHGLCPSGLRHTTTGCSLLLWLGHLWWRI